MISPRLSTRKCIGSLPGNSQTCISVCGTYPGTFRSQLALLFLPVVPCFLSWGFHPLGLLGKSHLSFFSILPPSSVFSWPLAFPYDGQAYYSCVTYLCSHSTLTPLGPWRQGWVWVIVTTAEPSTVPDLQRVYDKCLIKNSMKALVLMKTTHDEEGREKKYIGQLQKLKKSQNVLQLCPWSS